MESIIWGVPGVAVSLDGGDRDSMELDYEPAVTIAARVVEQVIERGLPKGVFLNVNVPGLSLIHI